MDEKSYKKLLDVLVSIVAEGIHIVDRDGTSIFYNDAMAKVEQTRKEEVLGVDYREAFPDIRLEESTIYQVLHHGKSLHNRRQRYVNLYGKTLHTINTTIPVRDDDGQVLFAIEVSNDISNLTELSDKIMQLQDEINRPGKSPKREIRRYCFNDLVGENTGFLRCIDWARRAAKTDAPVFLFGETGTGKELFAQSIHYGGARRNGPFLAQNCAALPENLLEGILFGTTKGGFTGAVDRAGLFEQASGGTLMLDELNSMPYELQSKLLRVLQEFYVRRVGGTKDIPVDVRIIATTNEEPQELIRKGLLRQDLYYRLSVVNIAIPPLRDRKDDLGLLCDLMIRRHSERFRKKVTGISPEALDLLAGYHFPGNVRELENLIMQALFLAEDEQILTPELFSLPKGQRWSRSEGEGYQIGDPLQDYIAETEKRILQEMLEKCHGNVSRCAAILQLKRQTLQAKLKKYEIL